MVLWRIKKKLRRFHFLSITVIPHVLILWQEIQICMGNDTNCNWCTDGGEF